MTDARCEPPEHLRGVDGWHWLAVGNREFCVKWLGANGSAAWVSAGGDIGPHRAATAWGWRYVAPVPSPEAVARLVEAGRHMFDNEATSAETGASEFLPQNIEALRAALAAFPEADNGQ